MKNFLPFLFLLPLLFTACSKEENLPATEYVMVKFQNKSGEDIQGLIVSRADVGDLKNGQTTSDYYPFETLGQQFGYALVEAVGTVKGKKHYTSSACQGVCGTDSAPHGTWLEPGYYKISIRIPKDELTALEFKVEE
ncbi:MAG: hypothetical protein H6577_01095 [Lewinellaceae bacterium]|nr:hypothetical protein [Saprospiraceae bacterium]MCB9336700.1 hypothetical protein [Lewinellaceae bacterium]